MRDKAEPSRHFNSGRFKEGDLVPPWVWGCGLGWSPTLGGGFGFSNRYRKGMLSRFSDVKRSPPKTSLVPKKADRSAVGRYSRRNCSPAPDKHPIVWRVPSEKLLALWVETEAVVFVPGLGKTTLVDIITSVVIPLASNFVKSRDVVVGDEVTGPLARYQSENTFHPRPTESVDGPEIAEHWFHLRVIWVLQRQRAHPTPVPVPRISFPRYILPSARLAHLARFGICQPRAIHFKWHRRRCRLYFQATEFSLFGPHPFRNVAVGLPR